MKFDNSWDKKTGFTTKQVLAVPIIFKKYMLGVIQLINRKSSDFFTKIDETSVEEMAKILGIALFNQKRIAKIKSGKFDYLLENHILTEKELSRAIEDARVRKQPVENVLMKDLKIPKKEIGQSLSKFYNVPFVEYNKTVVIPGELLTGLKVPFMRNNVWVPLRFEDGKIIIIIDDPQDLQRVGEIKSLFPGKIVTFHVALKQDVLDFIKLFTQDEKQMAGIEDIMSQLEEEEAEIEEAELGVDDQDSAIGLHVFSKIEVGVDAYQSSMIACKHAHGALAWPANIPKLTGDRWCWAKEKMLVNCGIPFAFKENDIVLPIGWCWTVLADKVVADQNCG